MKKILIPVIAVLAVLIAFVIYAVSFNYNRVQYDKNMISHMMSLGEGDLIAEYDDMTVRILDSNITRVQKVISVSDRKNLYLEPDYDKDSAVIITFPDGAGFIIAEDTSIVDGAFIIYSYDNKTRYFSVNGYRTYEWTLKAVAPEGINTPNEVIE